MERLQKYIASCGVASRRKAEELITEGKVQVNGRKVTELGVKINPQKDKVKVNGQLLAQEKPVYYLLNKPKGVITSVSDPQGRETVLDYIKMNLNAFILWDVSTYIQKVYYYLLMMVS